MDNDVLWFGRKRMAIAAIIGGLVLLTAGAEVLVRGAVGLARAVGLPSLIIGLTVVAFGTSAPELAVSTRAGLAGQADIALANVVGSNIFNVLFILGLSALIVPLAASAQLVRLDVPVMIGVCGLTWLFAVDGAIGRGEGIVLFVGVITYTALLIYMGKRKPPVVKPSGTDVAANKPMPLGFSVVLVAIGPGLLVLGARWLVDGAVDLARLLGVSELVIGLTIVAAGTSLPEAATSVVAGLRGQRDIAIGNVVGSNIFNVLAVLGAAASITPGGVRVAPEALRFDIPVMMAVAVACLPIFYTGGRICRAEGAMFLAYYAAYVAFLVLTAVHHASLPVFKTAMLGFAVPLSALGVGISIVLWRRTLHAARTPQ